MIQLLSSRAALVAALIFYQTASGADWEVVQTTTISAPSTTLSQVNVSSSNQAVNGIMLDVNNDSLSNSTQSLTAAGGDLTLEQTGLNTNANVQAVNLASAQSLDNVTQTVSGFNSVQISQSSQSGSGNVQALNYASSTGDTRDLSQFVTGTSVVASSSVAGNMQALNYTQASTYSGGLEQSVTLDTFEVSNLGGGEVYINSIQGDISGLNGPVIQSTNIGTVTVTDGSTYIMNHIAP